MIGSTLTAIITFMDPELLAVRSSWFLPVHHVGRNALCRALATHNLCRSRPFCRQSVPGYVFSPIKYPSWTIITAEPNRPSFIISSLPVGSEALEEARLNKPFANIPSIQERYLLEAWEDEYGGVIIDPNTLPLCTTAFVSSLRASLSSWKQKDKKGVWLKLPIERVNLVPAAIEEGFRYHHAEPAYVMLTYWIPEGPCMLPTNASNQVGVGTFVINDNREVLAVQEKQGALRGSGVWKMPTGLIHQSEDIFAGAIREVKEETGINSEFLEVIGFRHAHHVLFEKSDLFFVCMLKPLSSHIVKDDVEIHAAQWMPLEEFAAQPFYQKHNMLKKMLDICIANFENHYKGFSSFQMYSGCDEHPSYFYYNAKDIK